MLYYHTITNPLNFILSKLLFNSVLMLLMRYRFKPGTLFTFYGFSGFKISFVYRDFIFGRLEFKPCIYLASAIASKAQQNAAIMAILGFPIIIPQLLILMKISGTVFDVHASYFR